MIDPYLSDTLAAKYAKTPYSHRRLSSPPATPDELGAVDLVLCTHHHTDHMDPGTLAPLARRLPGLRFVVPAASAALAQDRAQAGRRTPHPARRRASRSRRSPELQFAHARRARNDRAGQVRAMPVSRLFDRLGRNVDLPFRRLHSLPGTGRGCRARRADSRPAAGERTLRSAASGAEYRRQFSCRGGDLVVRGGWRSGLDRTSLSACSPSIPPIPPRSTMRWRKHPFPRFGPGRRWSGLSAWTRLRGFPQGFAMTSIDPPPLRPSPVNVIEATRAAYDDLRKSERKVADVLLTDPGRILPATLAQTAEFAHVSQPTVIRFCDAIGCSGFQEFKLRLAHSLALGTPATHSVLSGADDLGAVVRRSSTTRSRASTGRATISTSPRLTRRSRCSGRRTRSNSSASAPPASSPGTRSRSFRSSAPLRGAAQFAPADHGRFNDAAGRCGGGHFQYRTHALDHRDRENAREPPAQR